MTIQQLFIDVLKYSILYSIKKLLTFCKLHQSTHVLCFCVLSQIIQRQLEQVEVKQRQLEERGVAVEKALRGEAGTCQSPVTFLSLSQSS